MPTRLNNFRWMILILLLGGITMKIFAQLPFVAYNDIVLTSGTSTLKNPWAGGMNCPQFSMIDLDQDGIKDLVTFERGDYGVFRTFKNYGTNSTVDFVYAPEFQSQFPNLHNWSVLVDYNCDGHEDLFTSVPAGLKIYRNNYTEIHGNDFVLETPLLQAEGLNGQDIVYVSPPDLPAIADIDGDGDVDILSFEILGNHVAYFKNMSMEKYGNCDHLEFELKNNCWGFFSEDATNNSINLYDTCDVNVSNPEKSAKHAGSTLLVFDANGDGVSDLALGDLSYNTMTLLINGGTTTASGMTQVEYDFPSNDTPIDMTVFPAAYLLDADNDGLKDMIVAPNNPNTSDNFNNIWFYKNTGSNEVPAFEFQQTDFLQESMIDVGEGAFAVFFDENGDGLQDVMVGNRGYFVESGVYQSQLALLRNTGSAGQPAFEWVTEDYAGFSAFNMNGMYPAFCDMDNDGDADMITGDEDGKLHYFRNGGGAGNPADFTLSQPNYKGIDVGQSAKPQIVDANRDGSPDLIMGKRDGRVSYFENTGTPENPEFNEEPTNDFFGGIDVMPECCTGFSTPFMAEDSTGNYLLYVGSEQGMLYLFNNIEGNISGNFNLVDSLYIYGQRVNVSGYDFNNDGKMELLSGKFAGGLGFLKNGVPQVYSVDETQNTRKSISLFPNPARDYLYVTYKSEQVPQNLQAQIIDIYGKTVLQQDMELSNNQYYLNTSGLSSGIYFLRLDVGYENPLLKFIIQ